MAYIGPKNYAHAKRSFYLEMVERGDSNNKWFWQKYSDEPLPNTWFNCADEWLDLLCLSDTVRHAFYDAMAQWADEEEDSLEHQRMLDQAYECGAID